MRSHTQALDILQQGTVIPATPLVLNKARRFDPAGQRRLIRYYLKAGAGGIASAVHTTQFEIRDKAFNLLEEVLRTSLDEINCFEAKTGKTVVRIAGVCGPTAQALNEANLAREMGYDAALLSPGGLAGYTEEMLLERTMAVAKVLPVIGFYLQPAVGGVRLSRDYWKKVADTPNVVAVKVAPFDRYATVDAVYGVMMSRNWEQVALYTGNDDNILFDLLGEFELPVEGSARKKSFVGGLLGQWSIWTSVVVALFARVRQARQAGSVPMELMRLAAQITDANAAVFDVRNGFAGCIAGIHEVLHRQGLMEGTWCLELTEGLSKGQAKEINRVLEMYPHLTDDGFVEAFLHED
ncbi:dihydrodipicolinate synthase family protein [Ruminococcaceae bacterium OttesenSCG-928-D13]|nr:dihydrodipicolinate synthase family protein [Ruminococcaceae bacterium OttesenSCG-928-D13]